MRLKISGPADDSSLNEIRSAPDKQIQVLKHKNNVNIMAGYTAYCTKNRQDTKSIPVFCTENNDYEPEKSQLFNMKR
jgi:uncharacterized Rmd1/YagE family protein